MFGGAEPLTARCGRVLSVRQNSVIVQGLSKWCGLGDLLSVGSGNAAWNAQIIAANPDTVTAKPMTASVNAKVGDPVQLLGPILVRPSQAWKGRVLNALGEPLDHGGAVAPEPLLGLSSGYIQRAADRSPKQGSVAPWQVHQSYLRDHRSMKRNPLIDDALELARRPTAVVGTGTPEPAAATR